MNENLITLKRIILKINLFPYNLTSPTINIKHHGLRKALKKRSVISKLPLKNILEPSQKRIYIVISYKGTKLKILFGKQRLTMKHQLYLTLSPTLKDSTNTLGRNKILNILLTNSKNQMDL